MQRRSRVNSFTAALVLVAVLGGAAWYFLQTSGPQRAGSTGQPERIRVERSDLGTFVKATGVIKPSVGAEVRVGSRASGVVEHLHVKVGDPVTKGQLLAELDNRDLVARRDQAAAELRRAQADLLFARADLQRKNQLHTATVIALSDLDAAQRTATVAEEQVGIAQAALQLAETQLGYARIVAPITGIVASVSTQEGETVSASLETPTFVTLIDLSRLEVRAYVDETDIGRIAADQEARFTVDTYGEEEFSGRVTTVYPKAEIRDNVVDYVTVIQFSPPADRILRPEMTTTVRIALSARRGVLTVPLRAVHSEAGQPSVLLWQGGELRPRAVKLGLRAEGRCEILSGLSEGDEIAATTDSSQGENHHD